MLVMRASVLVMRAPVLAIPAWPPWGQSVRGHEWAFFDARLD